nr:neurofilament triplet H1 [Iridovirus CN01]UPA43814.1 neurofilament triplet H1 [Iridovirus CN01]
MDLNSMKKPELQQLARDNELKGWSQLNIKDLRNFLKRNGVGTSRSRSRSTSSTRGAVARRPSARKASARKASGSNDCMKKLKKDIVADAKRLGVLINHPSGKAKTKEELCADIARNERSRSRSGSRSRTPSRPRSRTPPRPRSRTPSRQRPQSPVVGGRLAKAPCMKNLKNDIIEVARFWGILLKNPNGKAKTKEELCRDIERRERGSPVQSQVREDEEGAVGGVDDEEPRLAKPNCVQNLKNEIIKMARYRGISVNHPNGKAKNKAELCKDLERSSSRSSSSPKPPKKQLFGTDRLKKSPCIANLKPELVQVALDYNIDIDISGKPKTKQQLCNDIEKYLNAKREPVVQEDESSESEVEEEEVRDKTPKMEVLSDDMVPRAIVYPLLNMNKDMPKSEFLKDVNKANLMRYGAELGIRGKALPKSKMLEAIIEKKLAQRTPPPAHQISESGIPSEAAPSEVTTRPSSRSSSTSRSSTSTSRTSTSRSSSSRSLSASETRSKSLPSFSSSVSSSVSTNPEIADSIAEANKIDKNLAENIIQEIQEKTTDEAIKNQIDVEDGGINIENVKEIVKQDVARNIIERNVEENQNLTNAEKNKILNPLMSEDESSDEDEEYKRVSKTGAVPKGFKKSAFRKPSVPRQSKSVAFVSIPEISSSGEPSMYSIKQSESRRQPSARPSEFVSAAMAPSASRYNEFVSAPMEQPSASNFVSARASKYAPMITAESKSFQRTVPEQDYNLIKLRNETEIENILKEIQKPNADLSDINKIRHSVFKSLGLVN